MKNVKPTGTRADSPRAEPVGAHFNAPARLGRRALNAAMAAVLAVSLVPLPAFADAGAGTGASDDIPAAGDVPSYTAPEAEFEPGEILVQYDDAGEGRFGGLSLGLMESQLSAMAGIDVTETVAERSEDAGTVVKAEIADGEDPFEAAERAERVPGVTHAQPNFRYHLLEGVSTGDLAPAGLGSLAGEDPTAPANDTFLSQQWSLGSWEDTHGADVLEAWKSVKAGEPRSEHEPVTVAVLDTGIYANHLDLQPQIWEDYMWDAYHGGDPGKERFLDESPDGTGDIIGHGTHVAGIAAAATNNAQGIAGASYGAKILPIKVFNDSSYQAYAQTEWLYKAYRYMLDKDEDGESVAEKTNTRVVNMSLGGYGQEGDIDKLFENAIEEAKGEGIMTVCAGGNGDDYGNPIQRKTYPGDYDACVSVTCLSAAGTNTYWSDYNEYKDISAPGVDILASYNERDNSYAKLTGTSMASPLVAGIAALLFTADPQLEVDEAVEALQSTVNPLDPKGQNYRAPITEDNPNGVTGSPGCIDAAAAVDKVLQGASGVKRLDIAEACQIEAVPAQLFTGSEIEPAIKVTGPDPANAEQVKELELGVDYRVQFKDNVKVGQASAIVIGMNDFVGRSPVKFDIKYDFSKAVVMPEKESYQATGAAIEPVVRVALGGRLLAKGDDYTVAYSDNEAVGTGKIAVEGTGDYLGTVSEEFAIVSGSGTVEPTAAKRDLATAGIAAVKDQAYNKKGVKPAPKLTDASGAALASNTDYSLSYANNAKAGYATVTAKAKGSSWTGSKSTYFRILTAAPTLSDVKSSTKYAADARLAVRLGLMAAKSKKFNPGGSFTRSEAAVLLHTLAGKPKASKTTKMTDVKSSASNYKALQWACANGMLATASNKVQPTKAITQQDLANMIYRFGTIVKAGDMTVGVSKFFTAADRAKVSAASRVGVAWAAEKGALPLTTTKGKKYLNPATAVKRNVAAHMLVTGLDAIYLPNKARAASAGSLAAQVAQAASAASAFALLAELEPADDTASQAPVPAPEPASVAAAPVSQAVSASAAGELATAKGDFTYERVNGGLYITGYTGSDAEVEVPASVDGIAIGDGFAEGAVKGIGPDAFTKKSRILRSVKIPSSVEVIGARAFYGCVNLVSVEIGEGVESIGDEAFFGCSNLGSIELPASLTTLGKQPFANQRLKRIDVAEGSAAFKSVGGVLFSADLETLVCYPMGRTGGTYTVPEGTKAIGEAAFRGVPSASNKPLAAVELPGTVESIGASAFRDADSVLGIAVPDSVTSIGEYAFADMDSLKRLAIPTSVTVIPDGFARGSLKLVDFTLPSSVTYIGSDAFHDANIASARLPEGLAYIGARAFSGCKKMAGLSLPSTLSSLGQYAFQNCSGITNVGFSGTQLKSLPAGAFSGASALGSVEIPTSITSLGQECFWGCTSLSKVTFADSAADPCKLSGIPARAFTNASLSSVTVPASVTSIGASAFSGNAALKELVVQNQGTWNMGADAFAQAPLENVYGYRASSTAANLGSGLLRPIDVANALPLDGTYRVEAGKSVRLRTLVVSEHGLVTLQWMKGSDAVDGATGGVLSVASADAGDYTLVATSDLDPAHPVRFATRVAAVESLPLPISGATVSVADAAYTGKAVEPAVTVRYDGDTLEEGVDYTLAYSNNVRAGNATVTVTGKGEFTGAKPQTFKVVSQAGAYTDLKSGWYVAASKEAAARGLMDGTSATKFAPTANATRGQVASALYRVAYPGSKVSESMALGWAVSKKVFAKAGTAGDAITHQDLAVALLAFAKAYGVKTVGASAATFLGLSDFNSVAASARTACIFTSASGILGAAGDGKAKKFLPAGKTTRAELARAVVALDNLV